MSILIRTGSGRTDLSYTDAAVKNLKVLQKTSDKTVQWITTAAGTTYQNILQKRGVKDLFYGSITIPADIPIWAQNPTSGQYVTTSSGPYMPNDVGSIAIYSPANCPSVSANHNNMFPSSKLSSIKYQIQDMQVSGVGLSAGTGNSLGFRWFNNKGDYKTDWFRLIKKLFIIDNSTGEEYVALTNLGSREYEIYYFDYTNIFSNIKINNSHTYTVGIRSTVS